MFSKAEKWELEQLVYKVMERVEDQFNNEGRRWPYICSIQGLPTCTHEPHQHILRSRIVPPPTG